MLKLRAHLLQLDFLSLYPGLCVAGGSRDSNLSYRFRILDGSGTLSSLCAEALVLVLQLPYLNLQLPYLKLGGSEGTAHEFKELLEVLDLHLQPRRVKFLGRDWRVFQGTRSQLIQTPLLIVFKLRCPSQC